MCEAMGLGTMHFEACPPSISHSHLCFLAPLGKLAGQWPSLSHLNKDKLKMVTLFTMIKCMIMNVDHSRRRWGRCSGVAEEW